MDSLITLTAQYLLFPILIAAAATWLFLPGPDKVGLAVQSIVSLGAVLLAASLLVGVARVAAHVHHAQDIVAGVLIAALAVGAATAVWRWVRPRTSAAATERAGVHVIPRALSSP